ncbi:MAG: glycine zipper 2TM domain-containing protein [Nitrospirae bacterium]|nr:glycine zipper 2TM domain-containing protein [Nitrospirota bacterium]
MKKLISLILILVLANLVIGCTQYHAQGAGAGGAVGGVAGALLDHKNPWRGGVIGAILGGVLGTTLTDVSMRASQEAAATGKPVQYVTEDGRGVYRAEPVGYNAQTKCHKVHETVTENGVIVKNQEREICESDKTEQRY